MKNSKFTSREEKIKAVQAFKNGESVITLARIYQQERQTIYNWIKKFEKDPELTRVNGSGRKPKISQIDTKKLIKILMQPASKYGFETDLWNTTRIKILLKKEFRLEVSKMAVWRTLTAFKFSYKKVQKVYLEVDRKKQKAEIDKLVIDITEIVNKNKAILYFEDEANIQLSPVMGKTWAPRSEKVYHKVTSNRGSVAAISAISNDGRLLFNLFDKSKRFKAEDIINFLNEILKHHPNRHIVVVMDRAPCHTSKKVKSFTAEKKRLHVLYLPSRSPEFNPDEQVWGYLKNHCLKSHQETTIQGLKKLANKKLKLLAKDKRKLIGIFKGCENYSLYLK
jgi:transposase